MPPKVKSFVPSLLDAIPATRKEALFFDKNGLDLTLRQFSDLHKDPSYRQICKEKVGEWEVVTVWLGTDQGIGLGEEPQIFGTIAVKDGKYADELERFAATENEALQNHADLKLKLSQL